MDVLFGSIDVRDLLPSAAAAGEDDPTAPLSAPDLRLLIDRLSVRSLRIKDDVRRYLLSRRPDFSAAVSAAASASSSSENACASLSSALELLDARPIDAEIRDLAAEIGAKGRELAERREAALAVDAVAEVFRRVQSARRDLREGRIVDASEAMRDLKAALRVAGTEAEEEPKVYGLLREEWGDCFDELQEVLARHMESAVRFEAESGRLRIAGVMDYGFAKVADLMIKHVMNPAVRCASGIVFTEDCNQDSGLNADAILSIIMTSSPDIQGEQLSAVDIYSKLTQAKHKPEKNPENSVDLLFETGGCLVSQAASQLMELVHQTLKAISSANGFQNTHQMQQYESAKFSVDQVVFILEKVHIIWQPLLPTLIYRRTMCIVVEFILSRMTKEILLIDDMAAEETLQLQKLIHLTLENLCSLFESLVSDVNVKNNVLEKSMWIELEEMVPSLRKLRKLADLLDMPLKSITLAWESRELVTCGFTYSEVKNFIKAIFTDSPLRRECLLRIESANA
ncbi:hypothetical protein QJS10_CPB17g01991 [Acorus calamus]|uniref:HTH cro/C1-type domain-containing protein n=1 Tax=Acorus calamus TaxID=4465 RepID=A0AAV9CT24_ACOCL|nr:hypothetical protein QJS10_CPB17g01991 [Acorus calamus]